MRLQALYFAQEQLDRLSGYGIELAPWRDPRGRWDMAGRHIRRTTTSVRNIPASPDFFSTIVNMIGDGVYVTDDAGTIVMVNRSLCAMTGYAERELIGMYAPELYPSPDDPGLPPTVSRKAIERDYQEIFEGFYARHGAQSAYHAYLKKKDGTVFPIEMTITNITLSSQITSGIIACVRDVTERKEWEEEMIRARDALARARDELEQKVKERTRSLEETNTALRVLLKAREEDRAALEKSMLFHVRELVQPYIDKLKRSPLQELQKTYLSLIESSLNRFVSPFVTSTKQYGLTPTEIQIADLIKQGKTTKEIAQIMNCSPRTVDGHRDKIRRKLGIKNQRINLGAFLLSLE